MEPSERYEHAGVPVEIHWDDDGGHSNPRNMDSNVTTLVCWHPDYILGDEQIRGARGAVETVFETATGKTEFRSMEHVRRYLTLMRGAKRIAPLYLYDHSGISMSVGSPNAFDTGGWDTTMVGFAFCTEEGIAECCGEGDAYRTDEWIDAAIASDVETYNLYLTGQVYGFIVARGTEDEESCWGFLGDEHVKGEANEVAESVALVVAERERKRRLYLFAPETLVTA